MFGLFLLPSLCILSANCVPKHRNTAAFSLHVVEKSAVFDQGVEADIENDVVYYHTPAHNDLDEMHKVQDFKKNIEVSCYPSKSECFIGQLDRGLYPNAAHVAESLLYGFKQTGNSVSDKDYVAYYPKKWYKTGKTVDANTLNSKSAKEFVDFYGFKLYEIKLIPENAQFLDTSNNTSTEHSRRKRQLSLFHQPCDNDAGVVSKYGYTARNGGDWLYNCDPLSCTVSHVRDRIFYVCLCCPEANRLSECVHCRQLS